jgi:copper chaperone CopZ
MSQAQSKRQHRAHIASLTPGRVRFKLHPQSRGAATMQGIQTDLQSREGVQSVKVNPASGSVTMHFDPQYHTPADIIQLLEDVDVLVESIGHWPSMGEGLESGGFLAAVEDLNQRIYSATGIPVNLKQILPLSFVGAGIWSIAKKGLMVEAVPGWLFLWLAFDMFVKLHPPANNKTS